MDSWEVSQGDCGSQESLGSCIHGGVSSWELKAPSSVDEAAVSWPGTPLAFLSILCLRWDLLQVDLAHSLGCTGPAVPSRTGLQLCTALLLGTRLRKEKACPQIVGGLPSACRPFSSAVAPRVGCPRKRRHLKIPQVVLESPWVLLTWEKTTDHCVL